MTPRTQVHIHVNVPPICTHIHLHPHEHAHTQGKNESQITVIIIPDCSQAPPKCQGETLTCMPRVNPLNPRGPLSDTPSSVKETTGGPGFQLGVGHFLPGQVALTISRSAFSCCRSASTLLPCAAIARRKQSPRNSYSWTATPWITLTPSQVPAHS